MKQNKILWRNLGCDFTCSFCIVIYRRKVDWTWNKIKNSKIYDAFRNAIRGNKAIHNQAAFLGISTPAVRVAYL